MASSGNMKGGKFDHSAPTLDPSFRTLSGLGELYQCPLCHKDESKHSKQRHFIRHLRQAHNLNTVQIEELRANVLAKHVSENRAKGPESLQLHTDKKTESGARFAADPEDKFQVPLISLLRKTQMANRLGRFTGFVCLTILLTITAVVLTGDGDSRLAINEVLMDAVANTNSDADFQTSVLRGMTISDVTDSIGTIIDKIDSETTRIHKVQTSTDSQGNEVEVSRMMLGDYTQVIYMSLNVLARYENDKCAAVDEGLGTRECLKVVYTDRPEDYFNGIDGHEYRRQFRQIPYGDYQAFPTVQHDGRRGQWEFQQILIYGLYYYQPDLTSAWTNLTTNNFLDPLTYHVELRMLTYTQGSHQVNYHKLAFSRSEKYDGKKAAGFVPTISAYPITVMMNEWDDRRVLELRENDYQGVLRLRSGWVLQVVAAYLLLAMIYIEYHRIKRSYFSARARKYISRSKPEKEVLFGPRPPTRFKVRVLTFLFKWISVPRNFIEILALVATLVFQVAVTVASLQAYQADRDLQGGLDLKHSARLQNMLYSVEKTAQTTDVLIYLINVSLALAGMKLFIVLGEYPGVKAFSELFRIVWPKLKQLLVFYLLASSFLATMIYVIYQSTGGNRYFSNMGESYLQTILFTFGFVDFDSFTKQKVGAGSFAPLILILFFVFIVLLVLIAQNVFLALIVDAYSAASSSVEIDQELRLMGNQSLFSYLFSFMLVYVSRALYPLVMFLFVLVISSVIIVGSVVVLAATLFLSLLLVPVNMLRGDRPPLRPFTRLQDLCLERLADALDGVTLEENHKPFVHFNPHIAQYVSIPAGLLLWRLPFFSKLWGLGHSSLMNHINQIILEWRVAFSDHSLVLLTLFEHPYSGALPKEVTGTLLTRRQLHSHFSYPLDNRYPTTDRRIKKRNLDTTYWYFSPVLKARAWLNQKISYRRRSRAAAPATGLLSFSAPLTGEEYLDAVFSVYAREHPDLVKLRTTVRQRLSKYGCDLGYFLWDEERDKLSVLDKQVADLCEAVFFQLEFEEDLSLETVLTEALDHYLEGIDGLHEVMGGSDSANALLGPVGAAFLHESLLLRRYSTDGPIGDMDPLGRLILDGLVADGETTGAASRKERNGNGEGQEKPARHGGPGSREGRTLEGPIAGFLSRLRHRLEELEQRRIERMVEEGEVQHEKELAAAQARPPSDILQEVPGPQEYSSNGSTGGNGMRNVGQTAARSTGGEETSRYLPPSAPVNAFEPAQGAREGSGGSRSGRDVDSGRQGPSSAGGAATAPRSGPPPSGMFGAGSGGGSRVHPEPQSSLPGFTGQE